MQCATGVGYARAVEPPFKLPAGEADLAEWSVYGDWLLTKGDPMTELHDGDEVEIRDGYSTARVRCRFVANLRDR